MKIGEIAQQARVSKSIIRYYENKGVLPRASRNASGYRDYGVADLARIQLITGIRRLGCSLEDIREIMAFVDDECTPSSYVLELLAGKAKEVSKEIARLRRTQGHLLHLRELAAQRSQPPSQSPATPLSNETIGAAPSDNALAVRVEPVPELGEKDPGQVLEVG